MRIKILKAASVRLDTINSTNYPDGWEGDVADLIGAELVKSGHAVRVATQPAQLKPGQQFTDEQAAVLASAANQALAVVAAQAAGETVDPETGEIQTVAEVLAGLEAGELKEFAKTKGVKTVARKRAAIEADLVRIIEAEQAAAS
ncbi:MAG: hypothetical protein AB7S70_00550 [Hyphomicrobium sp.]|uniref:hypothetical protein n=1 Tax=Hyphomicrobium sp. TaxID=82 RepID=UPI003D135B40